MLQNLRDKVSGWIASVVMGLLIVPFAFVGVNQYLTGDSDNAVARVQAPPSWWASAPKFWPASMLWQHEDVSSDEFRAAFERQRQQQAQQLGDNFDARQFDTADNRRQVLDQLIDSKVLLLVAQQAGIVVGDDAVRQAIATEPAFLSDGKFDAARYATILSSQVPPLTPQQFEQKQRERLQMGVLPLGIGESGFVTPKEVDNAIRLLGETRDLSLAVLPAPAADTAPVSDDEIKAWYAVHAAEYRLPETVSVEYVDIDAAQLPAPAVADDAALRKRYDEEKGRFASAEQRAVSDIIVADPAKAADLVKQARAGADFAALAKANSLDPGSKANGGDLGWIARDGSYPKPFEDAAFALAADSVSEPVKVDNQWHVIKVREVKAGTGKSFEEVRDQLVQEDAQSARERAYTDLASKLTDETLKNPSALAPAAAAVNLPVQKAGPFARLDAPGVLANPAVLRAAFSESLVQDGTVSDPIQITPNHSIVLRVTDHVAERAEPLAQAHDAIVAAIHADRTRKAAEKTANDLLARLQKGEKLADVAASVGAKSSDVPGLPRGAPLPTREGNEAIFAVPAPAAGKPAVGRIPSPNGYLLFAVNAVHPGDLTKFTPADRQRLTLQLQQNNGQVAAEAWIAAQRKRFDIVVHEDKLQ